MGLGNIRFGGLGSGLDTNAIIEALLSVERAKVFQLEDQQGGFRQKISLFGQLKSLLGEVAAPIQLDLSATDHVLGPNNAELIRADVRSSIVEVSLDRSYHVATLDYDAEKIFAGSVDFIETHAQ